MSEDLHHIRNFLAAIDCARNVVRALFRKEASAWDPELLELRGIEFKVGDLHSLASAATNALAGSGPSWKERLDTLLGNFDYFVPFSRRAKEFALNAEAIQADIEEMRRTRQLAFYEEAQKQHSVASKNGGICYQKLAQLLAECDYYLDRGFQELAALEKSDIPVDKDKIAWSLPNSPTHWAKTYHISPSTFRRRRMDGTIRTKRLSVKRYHVALDDLPANYHEKAPQPSK